MKSFVNDNKIPFKFQIDNVIVNFVWLVIQCMVIKS